MAAFSNYAEDLLVNALLRGTSFTAPATPYVALFVSDPGEAGAGTEVSGGAYTRKAATFAAPSNGVTETTADLVFNQATADWGTVGYFAIFDASTGGNMLFHGALVTPKTIEIDDQFNIPAGNLTVTLL